MYLNTLVEILRLLWIDVHMSKGGVFSDMSITLSNHNNYKMNSTQYIKHITSKSLPCLTKRITGVVKKKPAYAPYVLENIFKM